MAQKQSRIDRKLTRRDGHHTEDDGSDQGSYRSRKDRHLVERGPWFGAVSGWRHLIAQPYAYPEALPAPPKIHAAIHHPP